MYNLLRCHVDDMRLEDLFDDCVICSNTYWNQPLYHHWTRLQIRLCTIARHTMTLLYLVRARDVSSDYRRDIKTSNIISSTPRPVTISKTNQNFLITILSKTCHDSNAQMSGEIEGSRERLTIQNREKKISPFNIGVANIVVCCIGT